MVDTLNGRLADDEAIWTQCKTKMTHIAVKLVDSKGQPVRGTAVQQRGLRLRLTLHKVSDDEAMHDGYNPRGQEGLFRGQHGNAFEPMVTMLESNHEFRFQVMLLSSDIGGAPHVRQGRARGSSGGLQPKPRRPIALLHQPRARPTSRS